MCAETRDKDILDVLLADDIQTRKDINQVLFCVVTGNTHIDTSMVSD